MITLTCKHCGKEFQTYLSRLKRGGGVFCCHTCASAFKSSKVKSWCTICGKECKPVSPSVQKRRKNSFCSKECQLDWVTLHPKADKVCDHCGKTFKARYFGSLNRYARFCSRNCSKSSIETGLRIPETGQRARLSGKYLTVSVNGTDKPYHVTVAEKALGRSLTGHIVHHIDGNPLNNAPDNLLVLENASEHRLLHTRLRIQKAGGDWRIDKICSSCKKMKKKEDFAINKFSWDNRATICKVCKNEKYKKIYAENGI